MVAKDLMATKLGTKQCRSLLWTNLAQMSLAPRDTDEHEADRVVDSLKRRWWSFAAVFLGDAVALQ